MIRYLDFKKCQTLFSFYYFFFHFFYSHGTQRVFSCRGIGIVVDWFLERNHRDIKVFVPKWREKSSRPESPIVDQEVLKRLEQDRLLVWTPSRTTSNNRIIKCYDDRYIIKHAVDNDGVVVSNDNFRDLMNENHDWKKVIEQRLLMYTFVDDKFMPPDDPLGRYGPTLDEFLKKGSGKLCPYLRNCTYGKRCRFLHPDRNPVKEVDSYLPSTEHLPPEVPYGQVSRPNRPLPPCPPEVPRNARPLPSVPTDFCQKPLPLPPHSEFPAEMARVFPPTLRSGQGVGIGQRRSDPLPGPKGLPPEVHMMQERFQRTHSMPSVPSVQEQACCGPPPGAITPVVRRGSVPHICHPPPPYTSPSGPPEIMVRGGSLPLPSFANESEWMLQEQMFGRHPYPFPPQFSSNPPVGSHPPASLPMNHWNLPPFPQQHPQYVAAHQQYQHYGPAPPGYASGYRRTPYHGQRNGYFQSRAPPIIGGMCDDVTDNPKESGDSPHEELRIQAYDKLCELFPDDVEKVLKLLDKYSDETSVETLTQHLLDDTDD